MSDLKIQSGLLTILMISYQGILLMENKSPFKELDTEKLKQKLITEFYDFMIKRKQKYIRIKILIFN